MVRAMRRIGSVSAMAAIACLISAAPAYAASPAVVIGHTDSHHLFGSTTQTTVSGPTLAAGTWWVTVTAELDASQTSATTEGETICQLVNGVSSSILDDSRWMLDFGNDTGRAVVSVLLTGVTTSSVSWRPDVTCSTKATGVSGIDLTFVRIDAVGGSLTSSGGPRLKTTAAGATTFAGDTNFHTAGSIDLGAGRWSILAKAIVRDPSLSVPVNVTCRLHPSASDNDLTTLSLVQGSTSPGNKGELGIQVAHDFSAATTVNLACRGDSAGGFAVDKVEIVALKAGKLTRGPLGGSLTTSGSGTPAVRSGFHTGSVSIPVSGSLTTLVSLALPAGKWYVSAKALVHGSNMSIECHLVNDEGGGSLDDTFVRGDPGGSTGLYMQNPVDELNAVHEALQCRSDAAGASLSNIRITAIQAKSISVVSLP